MSPCNHEPVCRLDQRSQPNSAALSENLCCEVRHVGSLVFPPHESLLRRLHRGAAGVSHNILDEVHDRHALTRISICTNLESRSWSPSLKEPRSGKCDRDRFHPLSDPRWAPTDCGNLRQDC